MLIPLSPKVSTHSRPKAAAVAEETKTRIEKVSTHSRPKAAASDRIRRLAIACSFQHTAARRRLRTIKFNVYHNHLVSTHSRPKAAAPNTMNIELAIYSFNTQPPEGGCQSKVRSIYQPSGFNTQPPEGGCVLIGAVTVMCELFQHTAARRRLRVREHRRALELEVSTHSRPKAAADV